MDSSPPKITMQLSPTERWNPEWEQTLKYGLVISAFTGRSHLFSADQAFSSTKIVCVQRVMAHACSLSIQETEQEDPAFKASLNYKVKC